MDQHGAGEPGASGERHRVAFAYRMDGDIRFISHRDTLRLFQRALARAQLPVRFSGGFNPQPRVMIPLPRSVGVASDAEFVVVEFTRDTQPDAARRRLQAQMPAGIALHAARRLAGGERLEPDMVTYHLELDGPPRDEVRGRVRTVLESDVLNVDRTDPKSRRVRTINVRPYIADMRVDDDGVVFVLHVTDRGTARPAEIAQLLGCDPDSINHRIRRMEVRWR
ncbi:MAG: TIGR03936 family radical SAM-associated protein [Phycisphaerae bacterium]